MHTLRNRTIIGIFWTGIGQLGGQGIHYVVLLVLASLLSPYDFGLLGVAMIFVNFMQAIGELGLAAALIQMKNVDDVDRNTVFWANLGASVLLALTAFIFADDITSFLGDVNASPLLKVLAVTFPITALAVVPRSILEKDLHFRQVSIRDLAGEVSFGLIGVVAACLGAGVWSLAGAVIAQRVTRTLTLWLSVRWIPRPIFSFHRFRNLIAFGFYSTLSSLFNKGLSNVDYFVVSKMFGSQALGYYTLAFQLAVIPLRSITGIVRKVTFPVFSKIQSDLVKIRMAFLRSLHYIFLLLLPMALLIVMLVPWFVQILYSEKWNRSIVPAQILSMAGVLYGFDLSDALYFALGKPVFRVKVIAMRIVIFLLFSLSFGGYFGIIGVAISLALAALTSALLSWRYVFRLIEIRFTDIIRNTWLPFAASLLAGISSVTISYKMISKPLQMISMGVVMMFVYMVIVGVYHRDKILNIRGIIRQLQQGNSL